MLELKLKYISTMDPEAIKLSWYLFSKYIFANFITQYNILNFVSTANTVVLYKNNNICAPKSLIWYPFYYFRKFDKIPKSIQIVIFVV